MRKNRTKKRRTKRRHRMRGGFWPFSGDKKPNDFLGISIPSIPHSRLNFHSQTA